jgi:peptidoglycan/LPS O-acetylase OafA/YrhL
MKSVIRTDAGGAIAPRQTPGRGHLPALDGLRGVAILLVLLTHAVALPLEPARTALDSAIHAVARVGWTGVDLFFVLSGFLITGILLDTRDEPRRWSRFYARRALRIFPLYYGMLIFLFVIFPRLVAWSEPQYLTLRANQSWYWAYAVNFLEVASKGKGTTLNTVHFWSLSIEEQFYVFWPFVVWACRPKTLFKIAGVIAIAGLAARIWFVAADPFNYPATSYLITPVRLDGLMMGAVLATLARMDGGLIRFRRIAPVTALAGAALLGGIGFARGAFQYSDPIISTLGFPLIAVTFGALLVTILNAPPTNWLGRIFSSVFLQSWGKYSYGVYVFHYLLILVVSWFFPIYQHESAWLGGSRLPAVLAFALLISAASYIVAWVSYNVYEKRFLALKRFFEREPVSPALPETAQIPKSPVLRPATGG